jgi:hypothetical protein
LLLLLLLPRELAVAIVDGIPWRRNTVVDFVGVVADIAVLKLASSSSHTRHRYREGRYVPRAVFAGMSFKNDHPNRIIFIPPTHFLACAITVRWVSMEKTRPRITSW